jgi:peptidoglycan-associated lipoprotein
MMNPNFRYRSATAGGFVLAALTSACATQQLEPSDASRPSAQAAATQNDVSALDREATVQISKAVRDRCGLAEGAQGAPKFEFDQATLHARGQNVLDDVARCLSEGPLKGEVVTIVGRADARGSDAHNDELGATRAAAARNYLAQRGVPADRLKIMSRGEQGSHGDSEASFALDRRIDIELGDLKSSPILEGSMMQAESSSASKSNAKAASYADTAEGGKPVAGDPKGSAAAP